MGGKSFYFSWKYATKYVSLGILIKQTIKVMNIQEITLDQISQIYIGKDNHCRCGCGGKYVSTSFMEEPRNTVDDKLAMTRLKRAKKLASNKSNQIEYGGNHINISFGNNRAITIYTDEVKK